MGKFGGGVIMAGFGLFWCSLTFLGDGAFLWNAARQLAATTYAVAPGVVTHSEVSVDHSGDSDSYKPLVQYRYSVNGQDYQAERVRYDFFGFGRERTAALVARYPAGREVRVYYNTSAPDQAVLELGLDVGNMFGMLFLAPFNAVACGFVGGFLGWLRSKRLGRPIAGVAVRDDGLTTTLRLYEFSPAAAALVGFGGAGFLATFGVLLLAWAIELEGALMLGWSATIAATITAWRYALKKRTELRRDITTGRVDIVYADGATASVAPDDLRSVRYTEKSTTDSDGDRVSRFPVSLEYFDQDQQRPIKVNLPELTTEEDAAKFSSWLNGVLGLKDLGKQDSPNDLFDDDDFDDDEEDADESTTMKE